ncbi:Arginine decarboxylase 2 [Vitis vinifera]|uniref:Arginine decarboxylase n=1 Tax=Vitis vinifera TaxID=29760 RepID=A0A438FF64_VITVI|nr:Arginine decarboxylase 2 [Vitis vinifera]
MLQLFPLTNILIDPHSSRQICIGSTFGGASYFSVNTSDNISSAFDFTIQSRGYGSHYQGVFRVKFNQDRFNVEDVMKFGSAFHFGLEAGSKSELLLAMSCLCKGNPEALLVYNGFKDANYIVFALVTRKLALNTVIIPEQEEELDQVFTTMHAIIFYA